MEKDSRLKNRSLRPNQTKLQNKLIVNREKGLLLEEIFGTMCHVKKIWNLRNEKICFKKCEKLLNMMKERRNVVNEVFC